VQAEIVRHVRHNFAVNILDGAFFGAALGFASYVTVVPLFIATLTDSTVIIGLMASLFSVGWQLPQLLTSNYVAGLRRFKPAVMLFTMMERWPFLALAAVAALVPIVGRDVALALALVFIVCQVLGGGLGATAWQSMIGKIIPSERRGTFYGLQSAAANLMQGIGLLFAGRLLVSLPSPQDFALCFLIASFCMVISFVFLARTHEPSVEPSSDHQQSWREVIRHSREILGQDVNFRWFLIARVLTQVAAMAISFYTIFAVRRFGLNEQIVAEMASVLTVGQVVAAPLLGWVGDRVGHRRILGIGGLIAALSAAVALSATAPAALYVAYALSGVSNATLWATAMSFTFDFGTPLQRPYYIGLANTLIAPATLVAPLIGGLLADSVGFQATFLLAALGGVASAVVLQFVVRDPHRTLQPIAAGD
jgi:MFS family permease